MTALLLLALALSQATVWCQFQSEGGSTQLTFNGQGLQGWLKDPTVSSIIMGGESCRFCAILSECMLQHSDTVSKSEKSDRYHTMEGTMVIGVIVQPRLTL